VVVNNLPRIGGVTNWSEVNELRSQAMELGLAMERTAGKLKADAVAKISAQAQASLLKSLTREYSLDEIAILTRAGPAKSLGLQDLGHLGVGARGDITVYRDAANREEMFAAPEYVFKNGELVVKNGKVVKVVQGATHVVRPQFDKGIEKPLNEYFDRYLTVRMDNFKLHDEEIVKGDKGAIVVQPTAARAASSIALFPVNVSNARSIFASDAASYITGTCINVDGGLSGVL
jgi:hypothetical protein